MDRRKFMGIVAATMVPAAAFAQAAPGIAASPELLGAFNSVQGISEGNGTVTLHILFAPWCHISPRLYKDSRSFTGRMQFNWIPFSGGQPEGSAAVERLLRNPFPSSISAVFTKLSPLGPKPETPLADAQDYAVFSRIQPMVIRDAGRGIVTPTLAYSMGVDRVRLIPGGIGPAELDLIARLGS